MPTGDSLFSEPPCKHRDPTPVLEKEREKEKKDETMASAVAGRAFAAVRCSRPQFLRLRAQQPQQQHFTKPAVRSFTAGAKGQT